MQFMVIEEGPLLKPRKFSCVSLFILFLGRPDRDRAVQSNIVKFRTFMTRLPTNWVNSYRKETDDSTDKSF